MTSQTWLTPADSDRSVWWHYIQVIVPNDLDLSLGNVAMMYINGGSNNDPTPTLPDPVVTQFAMAAKCITVELGTFFLSSNCQSVVVVAYFLCK